MKSSTFRHLLTPALLGIAAPASGTLIAHYPMEGSSSPLVDQVGGAQAGAVDAGHQYSLPGPAGFGNAVGLNDNGSWQLNASDSAPLNALLNDFSVSAWVYLDSSITKTGSNSNNFRVIGDDVAWDGDAWSFGVRDGSLLFTKNGVVDAFSSGGATVPNDEWVHIAASLSSTSGITFYLNGAVDGTNANTANNNPGDDLFGIGRSYGNGEGQYLAGRMDDVRVYDRVLTGSEVASLTIPEASTGLLVALAGLALGLQRRRS
jgi:hypothetical protein